MNPALYELDRPGIGATGQSPLRRKVRAHRPIPGRKTAGAVALTPDSSPPRLHFTPVFRRFTPVFRRFVASCLRIRAKALTIALVSFERQPCYLGPSGWDFQVRHTKRHRAGATAAQAAREWQQRPAAVSPAAWQPGEVFSGALGAVPREADCCSGLCFWG